MYLSKIIVNPKNYQVRQDLSDCVQLHQTILSLFPKVPEEVKDKNARAYFGVLYRTEQFFKETRFLLQSDVEPDWTVLPKGYITSNDAVATKNIDNLFNSLDEGGIYRFKLKANPTFKMKAKDSEKKVRIPYKREEKQLRWLSYKGNLHGFQLVPSQLNPEIPNVVVSNNTTLKGKRVKNNKKTMLTFHSVVFEGVLKIVNMMDFVNTLKKGIGSGKAYGFGLLSLAGGG